MSKYINNVYDYLPKDSINHSLSKKNNYIKEDKNLNNNSKARSDSLSIKNKTNSNSKNQCKVKCSNSILNNNTANNNIHQNPENKKILNINNKVNNSIGNIKEINYFINKKNYMNRNDNISSHNFYTNKINEILSDDNYYNKTIFNNKSANKTNNKCNTENYNNNELNNKTHSTILNNSNNISSLNKNIYNSKSKTKNIKNLKKGKSKNKGPKIIYAQYPKKRPSLPISNKYKNKLCANKNKSKNITKNSKSSKKNGNKISLIQKIQNTNNRNNHIYNTNILSSNYYTNYTNANVNNNSLNINTHNNNLIPISLKYKKTIKKKSDSTQKEIKKSQSQSYFKNRLNKDLNTSNSTKNYGKIKIKKDMNYKGTIMDKKNILKYKIIRSSPHSTKKNPVLSINYKNRNRNMSNNRNKRCNNNFNYFMNNNIPEEYNKNPLFIEIKNLWNKLKVTYAYQEMFITFTNQRENQNLLFSNEINNLSLILNYLNQLNEDIKKRNDIIDKIKFYNYVNFNENEKNIEEMKNLLISLRMVSIDVVNDYISFCKEISFDVLRNKINLDDIKSFNKAYINTMKTDTIFLNENIYLNKVFYFNNKSDPFLICPSLFSKNIKDNKYIKLPIDEETLNKINRCQYFMLTEKICEYSMCNNKDNINSLLSGKVNLIYDMIYNDKNDNNINCTISNNNNNNCSFGTPIIKNQNNNNINKTSVDTNKFEKFCNVNINNDNNKKNCEEKKSKEIETFSNDINNNKINKNINNDISKNDVESNKNDSIINNSNDINSSPIPSNVELNYLTITEDNSKMYITPYIPNKDINITSLYSTYLCSVPQNIRLSFDINEDIYYYANLGIYPKIILFKDNKNLNIKGLCTISFSHNINSIMSLNKKILEITSISCTAEAKISEILINLIEFCKKEEILYDSIEVNLYYIKKEDGNFVLDEGLEKEIKSEAKFKWVRLENDGEKRKIKYHYIPNNIITNKENSIFNNLNDNHLDNSNRCSILLNNHILIKYYKEIGINNISMVEHSKLFFILYLLKKYFLINENNDELEKQKENILVNLKGLKLKKIVRILSEYNSVMLTNAIDFRNDYLTNDNYNIDLINYFSDIIEKNQNDNENDVQNNNICLNFSNICTNFNNIIKIELNGYEYNIISMNEYIIEVFNINNDNDKEVLYFTKSEIENISFIFYEQSDENEKNNKIDENYIKLLFNKVLKKILVKDSEEPIKSYKKLAVPSFGYQKKISDDKNEEDKLKIIEYELLDCNESFDFCIENIPNYNTKFSFPLNKNIVDNDEIKVIKNNFVVAVLNPDLILDYHLPSMNIYYIDKEYWIKVKK